MEYEDDEIKTMLKIASGQYMTEADLNKMREDMLHIPHPRDRVNIFSKIKKFLSKFF